MNNIGRCSDTTMRRGRSACWTEAHLNYTTDLEVPQASRTPGHYHPLVPSTCGHPDPFADADAMVNPSWGDEWVAVEVAIPLRLAAGYDR